MPDPGIPSNPFPGLRPFDTVDRPVFFGREEQTVELARRLRISRFVAVVGTSGSGKSSLVRAGLIPALHGGLMAGVGTDWTMAVLRPGGDPMGALAQALVETGRFTTGENAVARLHATLARSALGLIEAVRRSALAPHENLLIVVDQFEEVFRFRDRFQSLEEEAGAWVRTLIEASRQKELPIFVLPTMRSDYIGDCAQFPNLPEAINEGEYLVPRMKREQYRIAIEGPVRVGGGRIAGRLVQRLLNELGNDPDQLPVLQHALMRTWDAWVRDHAADEPLDLRHYEAIGTMTQALSRHADEVFDELSEGRERFLAERLFKALTEHGLDNRGVRRPTRLGPTLGDQPRDPDLCSILQATPEELVPIIDRFRQPGRTFLMPPMNPPWRADLELDADPGEDTTDSAIRSREVANRTGESGSSRASATQALKPDTVIDISHESLMRVWTRLRTWVSEEAESARAYKRLADFMCLQQRGEEGLLRDPALQVTLDWKEKTRPVAAWGERYAEGFARAMAFLDASRDAREEARRKEVRRRRILLASISTVAAVFLLLFIFALSQRADATSRWRAGQAEAALPSRPDQAMWFATEAVRQSATDAARVALRRTLFAAPLVRNDWEPLAGQVGQATFNPVDSTFLVGAGTNAWVVNIESRRPPLLLRGHADLVRAVAFTSDGHRALTAGWDHRCLIWSTTPSWALQVAITNAPGPISDASFSLDDRHILTTTPGVALVWSTESGQEAIRIQPILSDGDEVMCGAFSADSLLVVLGTKHGALSIWRWQDGQRLWETNTTTSKAIYDVSFAREGGQFVTAGADGALLRWTPGEVSTPPNWKPESALLAHATNLPVTSISFSADDGLLLSGGDDGQAILWDWTHGIPLRSSRHAEPVKAVAFHPSGRQFLTATFQGSATNQSRTHLWSAGTRALPTDLNPPRASWVTFAADEKRAALGHGDGRGLRVFDPATLTVITNLDGRATRFDNGLFHPVTGDLITVGTVDNSPMVQVWRPADWTLERQTPLPTEGKILAVDRTGRWLAITHQKSVTVLDAKTWTVLAEIPAPGEPDAAFGDAAFSGDSRWLVAGGVRRALVVDAHDWSVTATLEHPRQARATAFHPRDSNRLVTASYLEGLRWYTRSNGKWSPTSTLQLPSDGDRNRVQSLRFTSDGGCLVSSELSGRIVLRDEPTRSVFGEIAGSTGTAPRLAGFTPTGRELWVFGPLGMVWDSRAWATLQGPDGLQENAQRRIRHLRPMTEDEWKQ